MPLPIDELIDSLFAPKDDQPKQNTKIIVPPASPTNTIPHTEPTVNNEQIIKCRIKRIFNNCPKPDGWYGMFASVSGKSDIRLSGTTNLNLSPGMQIEVSVIEDKKGSNHSQDAYIWKTIRILTKTTIGTINYLRALPGVSFDVAKKVVNEFNENALSEIENNIENVKRKCQLTDKQAAALAKGVKAENIQNEINKKLPELSANQINYCTERLGIKIDKLIDTIKDDPYLLCKVPSVTFITADTIALKFGTDPRSDYRIACGTKYIMNQNKNDLYVNLSNDAEFYPLYRKVASLLRLPDMDSMSYCNKLISISNDPKSPVTIYQYNNETHLYMSSILHATKSIAYHLTNNQNHAIYNDHTQIDNFISDYETMIGQQLHRNIKLNPEQCSAVHNALTNPISIVTGGPGRGKTMIIDCIANAWYQLNASMKISDVILLAPTGKAANKLNTMTHQRFSKNCMTVDRLICKLRRKSGSPIVITEKTLIIIDESSMLDVKKAAEFLEICSGAKVCFVGDIDQLPPIDIGNFFKDAIYSGRIPTTTLVTPMRNSGVLLANAEKINNNDPNLTYNFTDMPLLDFPADDANAQNAIIDQYFSEIQKVPNQDRSQVALLCPMKKGHSGAIQLNIAIQDKIIPLNASATMSFDLRRQRNVYNTKGYEIPNHLYGNSTHYTKFRVGDTVINTENNTYIQVFKYSNDDWFNGNPLELDQGITNGDCGTIIQYVPATSESGEMIVVQLFDGRFVELDASAGDFDKFELGYALTVHKSQGSEYHTVIYVSPKEMQTLTDIGFANKNIVYTALTRAQKRAVIIGSKEGLDASIKSSIKIGNTKLPDMIRNA